MACPSTPLYSCLFLAHVFTRISRALFLALNFFPGTAQQYYLLSHFIFIPLFLLPSCICVGLSSQKTTSTIFSINRHLDLKDEPYLQSANLKIKDFLLPSSKMQLQKICKVNFLQSTQSSTKNDFFVINNQPDPGSYRPVSTALHHCN